MALASTSPDPPSPLKNLDALYPLACTLVGNEAAPSLLVQVYERVADAPPNERPEAPEDWLALLLREAPEQGQAPSDPGAPDASSTPDAGSLRRDTAERLARNTLPVAFATCSTAERFVLALSASRLSEPPQPARLADLFEAPLPSSPSALLREKLRAVLSAPEAGLIDETLSDTELHGVLRDVLRDRFAPVPSSLRARLRAVRRSSPPTAGADAEDEGDPEGSASGDTSGGLLDRLPSRPKPRTLLFVLLLGGLVLGGGLGVSYLTGSSSSTSAPSPPTLTAFSAEQTGAVTIERATAQPAEAEAYLDSTWGRRVRLPSIEGAQLRGVGRLQAAGNTEIPVVLYTGDEGARIAAFVYSYALIDRLDDTATLNTQVRSQLAQRNQLVANGQAAGPGLLWRNRANIFVVVSPSLSPGTLRARVQP
ncbi:hypothetical protein [Salinibacter sp.]|uniref:hypothetical protein n=1 Tax=Salinibacter sp. TaxID=2065818 RepID=UPI0021E8DFB9|nr:hypothetical protein [Salinibacter sp.]